MRVMVYWRKVERARGNSHALFRHDKFQKSQWNGYTKCFIKLNVYQSNDRGNCVRNANIYLKINVHMQYNNKSFIQKPQNCRQLKIRR